MFLTFLDIDNTTSFSYNPFPDAPGSVPPWPGSINTFLILLVDPFPPEVEVLNKVFQVVGPTSPSISIPLAVWKLITAVLVSLP